MRATVRLGSAHASMRPWSVVMRAMVQPWSVIRANLRLRRARLSAAVKRVRGATVRPRRA